MKSGEILSAPSFEYFEGRNARLVLRGDWVVATLSGLDEAFRKLAETNAQDRLEHLDLSGLERLDTAGAYLIDRAVRGF
ncbi:MAG: STAS domain-containing protein, partial [Pseudomonadota bacterium]